MSSLRSGRLITRFAQTRFAADPPLRSLFDTLAFVYNKLRPQRQSYQDLVPTGTMPLPSFASGVAPAFSRYSLYTKAIKQLFHPSADAAFGGMDIYLEKVPCGFFRLLRNSYTDSKKLL